MHRVGASGDNGRRPPDACHPALVGPVLADITYIGAPSPAPPWVDLVVNVGLAENFASDTANVFGWESRDGEIARLQWIQNMEQTGGPWDFKHQGGVKNRYQDYGNWHYGVIGAALGISVEFLCIAAGRNHSQNNGTDFDPWNPPYGDDERDQKWIRKGYAYYIERTR